MVFAYRCSACLVTCCTESLGCEYNVIQLFLLGTCMYWGDQTDNLPYFMFVSAPINDPFAFGQSVTIFLLFGCGPTNDIFAACCSSCDVKQRLSCIAQSAGEKDGTDARSVPEPPG